LFDLPAIATRHGLQIDRRGKAIHIGAGRMVAWGSTELAFTTSSADDRAVAILQAKLGRVTGRGKGG